MRLAGCLLALCSASAVAGVVHGVVVESVSSRPLARTIVSLYTLQGGARRVVVSVLANRAGQFVFNAVPDGDYQVSAFRRGFAPAVWGQKRPYAAGTWFAVTAESVTFAEIRMARLGAISGRVLDENRVGLPETPVLAYPARIPLRPAAQVKSDDRGFYRLAGLTPGRYWVRTGAVELEDRTGLLPTFAPEYTGTRDARARPPRAAPASMDLTVWPRATTSCSRSRTRENRWRPTWSCTSTATPRTPTST